MSKRKKLPITKIIKDAIAYNESLNMIFVVKELKHLLPEIKEVEESMNPDNVAIEVLEKLLSWSYKSDDLGYRIVDESDIKNLILEIKNK